MDYSRDQILDKYEELPQVLKDAIFSEVTADKVFEIAKKHNLTVDKVGEMSSQIGYVMVGLTPSQDFLKNLADALRMTTEEVRPIAEDINRELFMPVRDHLRGLGKGEGSSQPSNQKPSSMIFPEHMTEVHRETVKEVTRVPETLRSSSFKDLREELAHEIGQSQAPQLKAEAPGKISYRSVDPYREPADATSSSAAASSLGTPKNSVPAKPPVPAAPSNAAPPKPPLSTTAAPAIPIPPLAKGNNAPPLKPVEVPPKSAAGALPGTPLSNVGTPPPPFRGYRLGSESPAGTQQKPPEEKKPAPTTPIFPNPAVPKPAPPAVKPQVSLNDLRKSLDNAMGTQPSAQSGPKPPVNTPPPRMEARPPVPPTTGGGDPYRESFK